MIVKVHGKDLSISPVTEKKIEESLEFLNRYLVIGKDDVDNCVVKKVGDNEIRIEITIQTKVGTLRAEVTAADLRTALDKACDRLERQLNTQKRKLYRRHKVSLAAYFMAMEEESDAKDDVVVRTKWIVAQKMSLDEAILQMEMLEHSFFIFTDEDSGEINVVYKRLDGGYGVIEAHADK